MLAADWNVGFIATDLNLLTVVGWFAILGPQDHGSFCGAILADGLDFIDFICQKKEVFGTLKKLITKIIFETKGHDWHA